MGSEELSLLTHTHTLRSLWLRGRAAASTGQAGRRPQAGEDRELWGRRILAKVQRERAGERELPATELGLEPQGGGSSRSGGGRIRLGPRVSTESLCGQDANVLITGKEGSEVSKGDGRMGKFLAGEEMPAKVKQK